MKLNMHVDTKYHFHYRVYMQLKFVKSRGKITNTIAMFGS